MKSNDQVTIPDRKKAKKRKKPAKNIHMDSIAQQYMELRRLRQQISEVESWHNARSA